MATAIGTGETRDVSIGRIFARAFDALRARPGPIFALAFVFAALPNTIVSFFSQGYRQVVLTPGTSGFAVSGARTGTFGAVGTLVGFFLSMLAFAAIARVIVAFTDGRALDPREAAASGLRVALPLTGLTVLLGLAVGFASILLLVPGIILFIMWSVAAPVRAIEPIGVFAAFGRSRALTKGARWRIFGFFAIGAIVAVLVLAVIGLVVAGVGGQGLAAMAQGGAGGFILFNAIVTTLASAVGGALNTALYVELRNWKDGPAVGALADIFA